MIDTILSKIKKVFSKPAGENPKPLNFKHNKRAYLGYLRRQHLWRWIRFSAIGIATTGCGFLILYMTVSHVGLRPILGYLIENAVMLQVGFLLNSFLTFGDRDTSWLKSLLRWYAMRASMFGVGQGIFFLLVSLIGLQYMLASLVIAASLGVLNYIISNTFAFSARFKPGLSGA